jgi:hypothetical protein
MTASTNRGLPRNRERTTLSRYDLVLAVIPAAFLLGLLAAASLSIPLETTLPASSLIGVLALADTLYLNPPTEGT